MILLLGQLAVGAALAALMIGKVMTGAIRVEEYRSFELIDDGSGGPISLSPSRKSDGASVGAGTHA